MQNRPPSFCFRDIGCSRLPTSQPYRFDLQLLSEQPDLDLESLLHRRAFLSFDAQGSGIHGQVYRVAQGDSGKRLSRYQVSLVPRLAYLDQRINQRLGDS